MSSPAIPYFTDIDFNNLEEVHEVQIEFEGREVEIDLNFESTSVDQAVIDQISHFLNKLPDIHQSNIKHIFTDFVEGETVVEYVRHHLDTLPEEDLAELLDDDYDDVDTTQEEKLLIALHLVRVGLYPGEGEEEAFAVCDYTIGYDYTDYLVVVKLNESGDLQEIVLES